MDGETRRLHPEASQEYLEAIQYYAAIGVELGERFDAEIQRLVGAVSRHPQRFFRFHPPAQRALSSEFPYSVVFLEQPDRVWILAVMHAKRRPGYCAIAFKSEIPCRRWAVSPALDDTARIFRWLGVSNPGPCSESC